MRTMLVGLSMAAALGVPAATAQAGSQRFMGGLTRQHDPIVVKLSSNARRITETEAALDLKCSGGGEVTMTDGYADVKVARSGRFHARYDTGNVELGDHTHGRLASSLAGRVGHGGSLVSGTWKLAWTFTDTDGTVSTCRSGPVHFRIES